MPSDVQTDQSQCDPHVPHFFTMSCNMSSHRTLVSLKIIVCNYVAERHMTYRVTSMYQHEHHTWATRLLMSGQMAYCFSSVSYHLSEGVLQIIWLTCCPKLAVTFFPLNMSCIAVALHTKVVMAGCFPASSSYNDNIDRVEFVSVLWLLCLQMATFCLTEIVKLTLEKDFVVTTTLFTYLLSKVSLIHWFFGWLILDFTTS